MNDPEINAAAERAMRDLTAWVQPVSHLAAPEEFARRFVEHLMSGPDRWRPVPLPPGHRPPGTGDPPNTEFQRARAEIQNPREDTP